jgi:hypothetical protein
VEEVGGDHDSQWNPDFGRFAQLALVACFYVPFDVVFEGWPPELVEEDTVSRIKSFVSKAVVGITYCVKMLRNWEDELVVSLASESPESSIDEHEVLDFEKKLVEGVVRQVSGELVGTEILSESGYVFFLFAEFVIDRETQGGVAVKTEDRDGETAQQGQHVAWEIDGPESECESCVNPFFVVVLFIVLSFCGCVSRQAIRPMVLLGWHMNKFEVKEADGGDPLVDGGIGLTVGVVEHALNKWRVHLDYEVVDADKVEAEGMECVEQAIKF